MNCFLKISQSLSAGVAAFWILSTTASAQQCSISTREQDILQRIDRAAGMMPRAMGQLAPNARFYVDWAGAEGSVVLTNKIGNQYKVDLASGQVEKGQFAAPYPQSNRDDIALLNVSPARTKAIKLKDFDLIAIDLGDGTEEQLTHDGRPDLAYGYGVLMGDGWIERRLAGDAHPPVGQWSPDGRYFATMKVDRRGLRDWPVVVADAEQDGHRLPRVLSNKIALPGDEKLVKASLVIFDMGSGKKREIKTPPQFIGWGYLPIVGAFQWSEDGESLWLGAESSDYKTIGIWQVKMSTGKARQIYEETYETSLRAAGNTIGRLFIPVGNDEFILYSKRGNGRGHYYLHSAKNGELIRALTAGDWSVDPGDWSNPATLDTIAVDRENRQFYFPGLGREAGRDPYYTHFYSVDLDTGAIQLLTPENRNHQVSVSVEHRMFVDQHSTVDTATTTLLRRLDGSAVTTIAKADVSKLKAAGWIAPQRVKLLAADGKTPIWGTLILPKGEMGDRCLPILDAIYAGPQTVTAPVDFLQGDWKYTQATAQMGFAVFQLDARGTPFRDQAFRDATYGRNFGSSIVADDHAAAIQQLAEQFTVIDPKRAGVYGSSWGGYYTVRLMAQRSDVFKAGVAAAGSHDNYLYPFEHDRWFGTMKDYPDTYDVQSNIKNASDIPGRLLLAHGTNDGDVHFMNSILMAGALAEKNVNFDMLILPDRGHSSITDDPYIILRTWNFFLDTLHGYSAPMRKVKTEEWPLGSWQEY